MGRFEPLVPCPGPGNGPCSALVEPGRRCRDCSAASFHILAATRPDPNPIPEKTLGGQRNVHKKTDD